MLWSCCFCSWGFGVRNRFNVFGFGVRGISGVLIDALMVV